MPEMPLIFARSELQIYLQSLWNISSSGDKLWHVWTKSCHILGPGAKKLLKHSDFIPVEKDHKRWCSSWSRRVWTWQLKGSVQLINILESWSFIKEYVVDTLDAKFRMKNQLLKRELIVAKGTFILDLIYILAKFNWEFIASCFAN